MKNIKEIRASLRKEADEAKIVAWNTIIDYWHHNYNKFGKNDTMYALSVLSSVPQSTLSKYKKKTDIPTFENIYMIGKALGYEPFIALALKEEKNEHQ